jgi:hypothetical protein
MATSLTPATLSVKITEAINLNGQPINSENTLTIASINEFDKRIMTLPQGSETTIIGFAGTQGAGTFVRGDMQYFRVTNKDSVNYARIRVKNSFYCFDVKLDAGKSMMMGNVKEYATSLAAPFISFVDADSITGQPYNGNIDIEYVVASL